MGKLAKKEGEKKYDGKVGEEVRWQESVKRWEIRGREEKGRKRTDGKVE